MRMYKAYLLFIVVATLLLLCGSASAQTCETCVSDCVINTCNPAYDSCVSQLECGLQGNWFYFTCINPADALYNYMYEYYACSYWLGIGPLGGYRYEVCLNIEAQHEASEQDCAIAANNIYNECAAPCQAVKDNCQYLYCQQEICEQYCY
jgi:hypothetical protein